jgi:7-carboxy-7-deazaguanine synthase
LKECFLRVNEIFFSVQGESSWSGLPCIFIRLSGCNLRCLYCDSRFAYEEGREYTLEKILKKIQAFSCTLVEITGGEPLLQKNAFLLAKELCDRGYQVLVETNGSIDIKQLDKRVVKIVDIKTPDSGSGESFFRDNIRRLQKKDEVKFVISSKKDYLFAKDMIGKYSLTERAGVLLSVAYGALEPSRVAKWVLKDGLNVRFQLQLNKYIWHPDKRGV